MEETRESKVVLVTGVSGYLGSWCMQKCLEAGFTVIGSVRDPDSNKCAFLREAIEGKSEKICKEATNLLTLIKADLLGGEEGWERVFASHPSINFVIHTASPVVTSHVKDPDEVLRPAIEGTTSILKVAIRHNVQRVVMTSSLAAVIEQPFISGKMYSSADWSNPSVQGVYGRSKTLAEKAAWEIVAGSKTELCTVNPFLILGPTLYSDLSSCGFESWELAERMCSGREAKVPNLRTGITDVRDVAEAHVRALTCERAAGKRLLCSQSASWYKEVQWRFADLAGVARAATMQPGDGKHPYLDKTFDVYAKQTNKLLGFEFIPEKATFKDMVGDLVRLGAIGAKKR